MPRYKFRMWPKGPVRVRKEGLLLKWLAKAKPGQVVQVWREKPKPKPLASRTIAQATKHIGTHETPAGSNRGKKIDTWLKRVGCPVGNPWCAAFVSCMVADAGGHLVGGGSASVRVLRERAQKAGRWKNAPARGRLGALHGDVHIVLVVKVKDGYVYTIEGNTRAANGTNYNGGEVATHRRSLREFSGFILPKDGKA